MVQPGDVLSYAGMCQHEGENLQRGMNFRLHSDISVILMSTRVGAPYADRVEEGGRVLIYEGHDVPRVTGGPDPKTVDQPMRTVGGRLSQNGLFYYAAHAYKTGKQGPELVKVYEKIMSGMWVYNGLFHLIDAWHEAENGRKVFKFRLELVDDIAQSPQPSVDLEHSRLIPTAVKLEVWKRDRGQCVLCGQKNNLHFDHIIPYSRGGSSLVADNIQLLCARHNLEKGNRIE